MELSGIKVNEWLLAVNYFHKKLHPGSKYTSDHNVIKSIGNEYVMVSLMYSGF